MNASSGDGTAVLRSFPGGTSNGVAPRRGFAHGVRAVRVYIALELGIVAITQILTTPGVELVGPLPRRWCGQCDLEVP
jgi:hypothetical protein